MEPESEKLGSGVSFDVAMISLAQPSPLNHIHERSHQAMIETPYLVPIALGDFVSLKRIFAHKFGSRFDMNLARKY